MSAVFQVPRSLFGTGVLEQLGDELSALGVRRPLLVSDKGLRQAGLIRRALDCLPIDSPVFDDVTPNPVFSDLDAALLLYRQAGCDGVVGLGGGSVLDVSKYVALLATHEGNVADYVGRPEPFARRDVPLVAIPTTAGTGSEASPDAGIHPDSASASVGISSRWAVPDVAILDPNLTVPLPVRLTAATGIDALTHCIEGFLSATDSPIADVLVLDGIRRVMAHVEDATRDGGNVHARSEMLAAGFAGGVGIGMGLGPAHAIAISCGDQGLHHGVLSGIGCVASLDAVLAHTPAKRAPLHAALGLSAQESASQAIAALMRRLGLAPTLAEVGYRVGSLHELAQAATTSVFNMSSRWRPAMSDYVSMIEASFEGRVTPLAFR